MSKVLLELDAQDGRIVAGALSLAMNELSDPENLFRSVLDPTRRKMFISLLGLMAGHMKQDETSRAISEGRLDEITYLMATKFFQIHELVQTILKQTDPHLFMEAPSRWG